MKVLFLSAVSGTSLLRETRNWKNETCADLNVAENCEFACGADLGDCIITCGSNDQECRTVCNRDYSYCLDKCPCYTKCPLGCDWCANPLCPDPIDDEQHAVLILSTYKENFLDSKDPVLMSFSGKFQLPLHYCDKIKAKHMRL